VTYSTHCLLALATLIPARPKASPSELDAVLEPAVQRVRDLVKSFLSHPITPAATAAFEQQFQEILREMGRVVTQWTYNNVEPAAVEALPKHVVFQSELYTRLNRKTPQNVWTLFGQLRLDRVSYRATEKNGQPSIFPAAMALGLLDGASPALAERVGLLVGAAGMTQQRVLDQLRRDHGVGWGVKKLREVSAALAAEVTVHRHEVQVQKVLEWLNQAESCRGRHKPVLAVGRDGVTLGLRRKGGCLFEVASTATVSVVDRRGNRLGTVYLAYTPESGQPTLSTALTKLLADVLQRWDQALPRLAYITDSGDNEVAYYETTLATMTHPRTGEALAWIRVVDYYHASQRVWTMAEALFGEGRLATSWARKMSKWLLKPGGVNRVLHSAAAFRDRTTLGKTAKAEFAKAYRYLRNRMRWMRYAEYRRVGVPLGSGVTEAACKTVYTQRLKLSGMRWKKAGAQTVLDLRVLQLSGVWAAAYQRVLEDRKQPQVWGQGDSVESKPALAA